MQRTKKPKIAPDGEPSGKKLPQSLLAFFALAQLCFGFRFGFAHSTCGKYKTAIHAITAIMGCLMVLTLSLSFISELVQFWMIAYFIQYLPTIFILFSAKYTLCEFLTDLIEEQPPTDQKCDKVGLITWCYAVSMFVVKILAASLHRALIYTDIKKVLIQSIMHIPMLGLDIMPIANFILFYYVYVRIRDLKIKVKRQEIDIYQLQAAYKTVANDLERFRSKYDAIFVWGLLTDSPKWMILIWNHLTIMKSTMSWFIRGCSYAWALHLTVQICVPAVFAEMINVENDAMKMILHEQISIETDETKSASLLRLLRYVEARPLLRKAWRLVPVDLQLPVTMLSICITYLIVIIQFSHLFD